MAPKSDSPDQIEVTNSSYNEDRKKGENKLPFKQRMTIRLTNLIQSTRLFIYNKEHQTFFGNSSSSWIKLSIYYFLFYVCLGLFYSGMVAVFGAIVSREEPRYWYHNNAMSDQNPVAVGMGFRPMPDLTSTSVVVYNGSTAQNQTISTLQSYQYAFLTQRITTYVQDCSPTAPASKLPTGYACRFSWIDIVTSDTHACSEKNAYGWPTGKPCMLIKLNQIYGWTPAVGNIIDQVNAAINQTVSLVDQREPNIYITCDGKQASDKAAIGSRIYYSLLSPLGNAYYGGIPYYFYPYMNSDAHVQPFVLVQFTSLPIDQAVTIECRAWAPNIEQFSQGSTNRGMVTFSLQRSSLTAAPKT